MVTIVITFNISLAIACLFLLWWLLQLQQKLRRANHALILAESKTHRVLHNAPYYIHQGEQGTQQLRQSLAQLGVMQQSINRWIALISLVRLIKPGRIKAYRILSSQKSRFQGK